MKGLRRRGLTSIFLLSLAFSGLLSCSEDGPFGPLYYVGDRSAEVYHKPSCRNLPVPAERVTFESCEEANDAGFMRCGFCSPCH